MIRPQGPARRLLRLRQGPPRPQEAQGQQRGQRQRRDDQLRGGGAGGQKQELSAALDLEEAGPGPREPPDRLQGEPRPPHEALQVGRLQRGDLARHQPQGRVEELSAALRDTAVGPGKAGCSTGVCPLMGDEE